MHENIDVRFIGSGHTHDKIDQAFSKALSCLQSKEWVILKEISAVVVRIIFKTSEVLYIKQNFSWSELCLKRDELKIVIPVFHFISIYCNQTTKKRKSGIISPLLFFPPDRITIEHVNMHCSVKALWELEELYSVFSFRKMCAKVVRFCAICQLFLRAPRM